ncbi:NADH:ubiquinone oxidoreductase complex I intermediate-associated protein 30 [Gonapodya prolifera JEL478]|uniref:NADH:ubiquinone oxidoreductase complex I intermediate-associated protein 30 n=1 Tax=Gonapodya prolifera (strain JEL478) TaxID=1344416 RepID=A0A139AWK4_GONPJ|nr:NADH:ubiquinone oxidoreductase complex I intermediate-associated protein 30 [Gonapodya prolifera JEL478]|eukprot:KXS21108.1 NADH:ubiquinone oxidoreductase complex I intermediate-associated protein 30 [Gonapodya prolifera JEL478]
MLCAAAIPHLTRGSKNGRILYLFGGSKPWSVAQWTDSDDRVRGGSSRSHLSLLDTEGTAVRFHGTLDTTTLGGAGFASQRTVGELSLDVSAYDGFVLWVGKNDGKKYAFNVKDVLPPVEAGVREQSTLSWEFFFVPPLEGGAVVVEWSQLVPTYRGRVQTDPPPLDKKSIKRFSIMARSFFDQQSGEFSLVINSIAAFKKPFWYPEGTALTKQSSQV